MPSFSVLAATVMSSQYAEYGRTRQDLSRAEPFLGVHVYRRQYDQKSESGVRNKRLQKKTRLPSHVPTAQG